MVSLVIVYEANVPCRVDKVEVVVKKQCAAATFEHSCLLTRIDLIISLVESNMAVLIMQYMHRHTHYFCLRYSVSLPKVRVYYYQMIFGMHMLYNLIMMEKTTIAS
jgi:hypothetical protein